MSKSGGAWQAMHQWSWDRTGTAKPPTVNQLLRYTVMYIYNGVPLLPSQAYSYYGGCAFDACVKYHARDIKRPVVERGIVKSYEECPGLDKARALWQRYARLCHYMWEKRHDWQFVETIHWADNSVEDVYISQLTGERRYTMTKAPSGDACF